MVSQKEFITDFIKSGLSRELKVQINFNFVQGDLYCVKFDKRGFPRRLKNKVIKNTLFFALTYNLREINPASYGFKIKEDFEIFHDLAANKRTSIYIIK